MTRPLLVCGRLAVAGLVALLGVAACGGRGPTAPSGVDRLQLPLGAYTFMASATASQSPPCTTTGSMAPAFRLFARVTLAHEGQEWVARSSTIADGNIELRFHDTGGGTSFGGSVVTVAVSGTIRGTGTSRHNDTLSIKQFISFTGTGGVPTAQLEGTTGTPISPTIVFGTVTGSVIVTDSLGGVATCSTLHEWSIQPRTGA